MPRQSSRTFVQAGAVMGGYERTRGFVKGEGCEKHEYRGPERDENEAVSAKEGRAGRIAREGGHI